MTLVGADLDESPMAYRRLPKALACHAASAKVLHTLRPFAVAMAGQAEFEGGERLVAVVSKPIYRVNVNKGLRSGNELNAYFLVLDGVARAEGCDAASSAVSHCRE